METLSKDIVIVTLEFAREKFLKGEYIDFGELNNFLVRNNHIDPSDPNRDPLVLALFNQIFGSLMPTTGKRIMSLEAYLGLIDYEDLKQARKDSQEAREESRTALFWAKISFLMATVVGIVQILIAILSKP